VSAAAGVVLVAMFLLVAFLFGVILWRREGQMDRTDDTVDAHDRLLILLEGRINGIADHLGIDVHDPISDGCEYVPEPAWQPRAMEQPTLEPVTEPIEIAPATVPDGMPLAVQSALIAAPSVDVTWEQKSAALMAEWERAAAEIGGAA
jgi:hypothetical protein